MASLHSEVLKGRR